MSEQIGVPLSPAKRRVVRQLITSAMVYLRADYPEPPSLGIREVLLRLEAARDLLDEELHNGE